MKGYIWQCICTWKEFNFLNLRLCVFMLKRLVSNFDTSLVIKYVCEITSMLSAMLDEVKTKRHLILLFIPTHYVWFYFLITLWLSLFHR